MRILITANTSWYIYNFRKNLIGSLRNAGHDVIVIAPEDSHTENLCNCGITYIPITLSQRSINPLAEFKSCLAYYRLLRKLSPDYVLTHTVKCNLYVGLCRYFLRFKHIANVSGLGEMFDNPGLLRMTVSFLYRFALQNSRRIFFQNAEDMQTAVASHLVPHDCCSRIPGSGANLKTFCPSPEYTPNNPLRFLMFGRLVPKKGYDLFLNIAKKVNSNGNNHLAEFWIMGIQDNSRKESHRLFERIRSCHELGIVKYLPARNNVSSILQTADIVVLPSQYNEGTPKSLIEALACGKPVITTDWKGCRDTVDHGKNGFLVTPGSTEDLERCIMRMINMPTERLLAMDRYSRQKAVTEFDETFVIQAYLDEIGELIPTESPNRQYQLTN